MPRKSVVVIGSLNIDFITRTTRLPAAGETLAALSFDTGFGGKGANQCVASARLSGGDDTASDNDPDAAVVTVRMVGHIGDDAFGTDYLAALRAEGVDVSGVRALAGQRTGVTNIIVEEATGENRILFVPNANAAFGEDPGADWELVPVEGEVVVLQMEIPMRVMLHNLARAREAGKHVILNPAPAARLPDTAYRDIDTLIMNETESAILAGGAEPVSVDDQEALLELARRFLSWGVRDAVVITLGAKGSLYCTASGVQGFVPARKVRVVDTTAAGDTFVGAYAVQRARYGSGGAGFDFESALRFATLAASKTVEKAGAMAAIPRLAELSTGD